MSDDMICCHWVNSDERVVSGGATWGRHERWGLRARVELDCRERLPGRGRCVRSARRRWANNDRRRRVVGVGGQRRGGLRGWRGRHSGVVPVGRVVPGAWGRWPVNVWAVTRARRRRKGRSGPRSVRLRECVGRHIHPVAVDRRRRTRRSVCRRRTRWLRHRRRNSICQWHLIIFY